MLTTRADGIRPGRYPRFRHHCPTLTPGSCRASSVLGTEGTPGRTCPATTERGRPRRARSQLVSRPRTLDLDRSPAQARERLEGRRVRLVNKEGQAAHRGRAQRLRAGASRDGVRGGTGALRLRRRFRGDSRHQGCPSWERASPFGSAGGVNEFVGVAMLGYGVVLFFYEGDSGLFFPALGMIFATVGLVAIYWGRRLLRVSRESEDLPGSQ